LWLGLETIFCCGPGESQALVQYTIEAVIPKKKPVESTARVRSYDVLCDETAISRAGERVARLTTTNCVSRPLRFRSPPRIDIRLRSCRERESSRKNNSLSVGGQEGGRMVRVRLSNLTSAGRVRKLPEGPCRAVLRSSKLDRVSGPPPWRSVTRARYDGDDGPVRSVNQLPLTHAIEKSGSRDRTKNTATEHAQPVINRYRGRGVSPGRVSAQTRPTPRAESSVGIGYVVADGGSQTPGTHAGTQERLGVHGLRSGSRLPLSKRHLKIIPVCPCHRTAVVTP